MKEIAKKNRTVSNARAEANTENSVQSKLDKANELLSRINPANIEAIVHRPVHNQRTEP